MNLKTVLIVALTLLFTATISNAQNSGEKTYTNADFYKDGVFQKEVAKQAVKELILRHGELWTAQIEQNFWVSDFGLGDYEHVGLASVTWVNDSIYGYFAMTMYLLPEQMIPEHIHRPVTGVPAKPAKYESWKVLRGWIYNFSEVGETMQDMPIIPRSFGNIRSKNFRTVRAGETDRLKQLETYHFMMAGNEGAIVDEYGVHHDRRGWFSSNPKAHPSK
ncbi:hypothetical protein [Parabacteroides sp.]